MTKYIKRSCILCANVQIMDYGWGKQEIKDCKGRDLNRNHSCDVFTPSKQVKNWLKFNEDYELLKGDVE